MPQDRKIVIAIERGRQWAIETQPQFAGSHPDADLIKWPMELSLGWLDFATIWTAIGATRHAGESYAGAIDGRVLMRVITSSRAVFVAHRDQVPRTDAPVAVGVDPELAKRSIDRMFDIAYEAERREELVVWRESE